MRINSGVLIAAAIALLVALLVSFMPPDEPEVVSRYAVVNAQGVIVGWLNLADGVIEPDLENSF